MCTERDLLALEIKLQSVELCELEKLVVKSTSLETCHRRRYFYAPCQKIWQRWEHEAEHNAQSSCSTIENGFSPIDNHFS